jgi:hypothetical protein
VVDVQPVPPVVQLPVPAEPLESDAAALKLQVCESCGVTLSQSVRMT